QDFVCSPEFSTKVSALNVGQNRVNSARLEISLNGRIVQSRNFSMGLAPGGTALLTFSPIEIPCSGISDFRVEILSVNGATDPDLSDISMQTRPRIQPSLTVAYAFQSQDF